MSTPTIDEVVGQAIDETEEPKEPLKVEEEAEPQKEPSDAGAPEEKQPEEESFTTFRPEDLPPELQQVYKRWQSDYTQKRQAEKAELKRLQEENESLKKRSEQSAPSQTEIATSYERDRRTGQIDPRMSLEEYTQKLEESILAKVKAQQENSFVETQEKAFFELDPRLNEDAPDYDPVLLNYVAGEVSRMRDAYEQENGSVLGFDFVGNAKQFIKNYEERIASLNKAFVAKQSELAKSNASKFAKATPKAVSSPKGKASGKMSLDDAFDAALESTGAQL